MTNPIEELKERLKHLEETPDPVPGMATLYHDLAKDYKVLAECYREIAIRIDSNLNALNDGYSPQEPVDRIASELFQGRTK